ncbi:MAG: OsmC family protein [Anaerolineales bacterium]
MDDCEDCDSNKNYEEIIRENVDFEGDLDEKTIKKLHQIAKACSVRRLLENGIQVKTE